MNKNTTTELDAERSCLLAPSLAGKMLSTALGESEVVWAMRLTNWRRPERRGPIEWQETSAGRPVYEANEIQDFIERSLLRREATSPPSPDRGKSKATATADIESNKPFVRVFWNAGTAQGSFSLSVEAARAFARKLESAAANVGTIEQDRYL